MISQSQSKHHGVPPDGKRRGTLRRAPGQEARPGGSLRRRWMWAGAVLLLALGPGSPALRAQHDADMPEEHAAAPPARRRPAADVPPPAGITFTTRLDHTAVWVGDQFHYMIIVDHTPNFEFVLDNLSKETVNMDPFQVVDVRKQTTTLKNGNKRLFLDVGLTSFATALNAQQIPQLTLFYFQRERGTVGAEEAAAESLTVPGSILGLRTTLPPTVNDIRDAITVSGWERSRWVIATAGMVAATLLALGVGWETVAFVRRRKSRRGPDRRKAMEAVRARWAGAVPPDFSDAGTVMEFYNQSYQNLKEYLGYYLETPTLGLTADELQQEMQRLGSNPDLTQKVGSVLETLETVRYSWNGTAPSRESVQGTAQQIREIFSASSKR